MGESIVLIYSILLAGVYAGLMYRYRRDWLATPIFRLQPHFQPHTRITVLIPARNEAAQIEDCVRSVLAQDYPADLFEVIVIDDHSEDDTAAKVTSIADARLSLLSLAEHLPPGEHQAYKKKAIELGIQKAKGELIVCTDADCLVPPSWLSLLAQYYETESVKFIAAPVNFYQESSAFEYFQSLDFTGMMGITAAGIRGSYLHMCNGANLAYARDAFYAVDGFRGIDQRASGDDMMLLQKIAARFPGQIGFLKSHAATVRTCAQPNWTAFYRQRLRWASKSRDYPEWRATVMLGMVFLFCVQILLSILLVPWLGWLAVGLTFSLFLCKAAIDYWFLRSTAQFFQRQDLLRYFWSAQVWHILYIVSVGTMANLVSRYQWKGRTTR